MKKKRRQRRKPPAKPGAVSIHRVAREAGVSIATVSRALNMPDKVSEHTRERVQQAIDALNYVPSGTARALITRSTQLVGAVIPHIAHSIYATFIESAQARLREQGYHLILSLAGYDRADELAEIRHLVTAGVEALLIAGHQHEPEIFDLLDAKHIPFVATSVYDPGHTCPCVGYDNVDLAVQITRHLLDLGHERIATVTGHCSIIDRFAQRVDGIRLALEERGLTLPDDWVVQRNVEIAAAQDGLRYLMAKTTKPTAIIGGNDIMALGVMMEAEKFGLTIPDDLSVTGFDDLDWAKHAKPSLTTIQIDVVQLGVCAADYLLARLRGEPVAHATRIETKLVVRDSTGPYRPSGVSHNNQT